ncbi:hypothetical protein GF366_02205 [Candidatus Peregrinibacteria bacterium]|nr:hypothetical protein [Candidatus Peregrinibacteria bacterium]
MFYLRIKKSILQTLNAFKRSIFILFSVLLLISLFITAVPKDFYSKVFTGNYAIDSLIGSIFGSIAVGNPLNSYIIGGELLDKGISLVAVTAFILSWVTVGVVQLPAEFVMLGKKFAISRNLFSFLTAIIVAILTTVTLSFI